MRPPRLITLLVIPLTALGCGALAWVKHPPTLHQVLIGLAHHPLWCAWIGVGLAVLLPLSLFVFMNFEESLNGGQPESEDSLPNEIARSLQRDLDGPFYRRWW